MILCYVAWRINWDNFYEILIRSQYDNYIDCISSISSIKKQSPENSIMDHLNMNSFTLAIYMCFS